MRIGLLGGTFDPPHIGHLIVAQDAWSALKLDRVVFVPAAVPPHKAGRVEASAELRLEMLRAACGDDPRFAIDDLELRRPGPSYSVDTVREYRHRYPEATLYLLIGVDQYTQFDTWREPDTIRSMATVVVLSRSGEPARPSGAGADVGLEVTRIDVSATEIRRRVAAGEPIRYLVPDGVRSIIEREGLYRAGVPARPSV
ncbi:MAG TPA: nicotinate-nucleotide adenylyltransferase [Longimicrobiales bacterium]|nr:nicotinate-nucleotide adenylyltransferase [Longimicrobiales bacterium]